MYEIFDHTADLGLRVRAEDLNTLFAEAGRCLFSLIVEDIRTIRPAVEHQITIPGTDREYLLFDWLKELLYRFDADHWVYGEFSVTIDEETGLTAQVRGESLDRDRHSLDYEVKAITYHDLRVGQTDDGWLAEVIVDI